MASLSFTLATTTTTSCTPFFSQTLAQKPRLNTYFKQTHGFQVSCNVSSDNNENPPPQKLILPETTLDWQNVDRRNVLLGLGGVSLSGLPSSAFAAPIKTPWVSEGKSCGDAKSGVRNKDKAIRSLQCCPPTSNVEEKKYKIPYDGRRVRQPMRNGSDAVKKYQKALARMRALDKEDPDDPRGFTNQAKVHCAYCNGSYTQSDQELQIHNSWLFFPFHRWYIYFFERILGELISDPTFALPYWNWDSPEGMAIPDLFLSNDYLPEKAIKPTNNPLYDKYRNEYHLAGAVVDLDFQGKDRVGVKLADMQEINYTTMNRQMMRNAFDTKNFFGGKYVLGAEPIPNGEYIVGSVEAGCHTALHRWVGKADRTLFPNGEDMANFYSAGYDPLFYVHHANVDRMWTLWKDMGGKAPVDEEWKDASYVFYDEKKNPVRVYNREAEDLDKTMYEYATTKTQWTSRPPRSRCNRPGFEKRRSKEFFNDIKYERFPLNLTETKRLLVPRPKESLSMDEDSKKTTREILWLNGINYDGTTSVKFDVFVNDCDEATITPCDSENVGTFSTIAQKGMKMGCKTGIRFSISELLKETEAEKDTYIRVTIKPQDIGKGVTIDQIKILLVPILAPVSPKEEKTVLPNKEEKTLLPEEQKSVDLLEEQEPVVSEQSK